MYNKLNKLYNNKLLDLFINLFLLFLYLKILIIKN